ncbi:MAG: type II toxin-antitoxin system RelB/DinJ family antitoxin [Thermodesulfobacteriota bacterium]|nr:type II toxin-antitoxin system RelB/DinJ family antitoxin [Thermodesulfobacteriota bacterium]
MASNALVTTRIDKKIKSDSASVLDAMGLSLSDAVRMLLTRVAREGVLPFEPLVPNAETIAAMKEARAGKLASFNSVEDLMKDLDADD